MEIRDVYGVTDRGDLYARGFGERRNGEIILSPYEVVYLMEKGEVERDPEFISRVQEREPRFFTRYLVFKDIRDRGYVIKAGMKFGAYFRVYPRGKKPGEAHTEYVVLVVQEEDRLSPADIVRFVRLARALRTKAVLAFVDNDGGIVYYKIEKRDL